MIRTAAFILCCVLLLTIAACCMLFGITLAFAMLYALTFGVAMVLLAFGTQFKDYARKIEEQCDEPKESDSKSEGEE